MTDPLKPPATILVKLGSALVHAEEWISPHGDPADRAALFSIFEDPEIIEWREAMNAAGLLPVKR